MWFEESVFYQIYPLGLCGAPRENDGGTEPRILKLLDWVPHIKKLGADAVYFCPVFESDAHGYDTRDYTKLDGRLGTNADFAPSGTYWRSGRPARTGIGSTLTSAAIRVTTTACGTRAGRAITSL